jgi:hypothetical protein
MVYFYLMVSRSLSRVFFSLPSVEMRDSKRARV